MNETPIGSQWDTHAGNIWEVVAHLPNDRVRVKCVRSWEKRVSPYTFVWHVSSLTGGTRVR